MIGAAIAASPELEEEVQGISNSRNVRWGTAQVDSGSAISLPSSDPDKQDGISAEGTSKSDGPEVEMQATMTVKNSWISELPYPTRNRRTWSVNRKKVANLFESRPFDMIMGAIILFNVGLMVVEADIGATCEDVNSLCTPRWVATINHVLLGVYTAEILVRLYAYRSYFLKNRWNIVDTLIVSVGFMEVLMQGYSGLQVVRICRLGRLARLLRLLRVFPMLYSMIKGFASTMTTILWGFALILALLLVWSLIAVEIVHPRNTKLYASNGGSHEDWCFIAYSSVGNSIVYLFQTLVAGDSWGACSIPLMREYPETFLIFSFAYITVQLGFTNLILAVIVDAAAKAREGDWHQKLKEKKQQEKEATEKLYAMIKRMDVDGNGSISWKELQHSFRHDREVRNLMTMLDIDEKDLARMFTLMDADHSGNLDYSEFVEAISKAEEQDVRVQMMILKLQVAELSWKFDQCMAGGILPKTAKKDEAECGEEDSEKTEKKSSGESRRKKREKEKEKDRVKSENTTDLAVGLERELSALHMELVQKLEALSQDAANQVSVLLEQTKALSISTTDGEVKGGDAGTQERSNWSKSNNGAAALCVVPSRAPCVIQSGGGAQETSQTQPWREPSWPREPLSGPGKDPTRRSGSNTSDRGLGTAGRAPPVFSAL